MVGDQGGDVAGLELGEFTLGKVPGQVLLGEAVRQCVEPMNP